MPSTKENKGVETTRHETVRARLTDIEMKMVQKVKQHYHFKTDTELVLALVKRAHLNITQ